MNPNLIPSLLKIQHRRGYLPHAELELLAVSAGVPLYRLQELTTFFPHFRREEPPTVSVLVCQSMTCHLRGSAKMLESANALVKKEPPSSNGHRHPLPLEVRGVPCLGRCDLAPVAYISRHGHGEGQPKEIHEHLVAQLGQGGRDLAKLIQAVQGGGDVPKLYEPPPIAPGDWQIDLYRAAAPNERFAAVRKFLKDEADPKQSSDKLTPEVVLARLKEASLFGMGGAAATTWRKWDDVRKAAQERQVGAFLVANGDESEPGTFKDREILLHSPYLVVEGMLLGGLMMHAAKPGGPVAGYIYIRHEYPDQIAACREAIEDGKKLVPEAFERCNLEVYVSPGRYICGEESALIEAIEGKRAQPREKQPTIKTNGLGDKPTLLNNIETYSWVPTIVLRKSGWSEQTPRRFFSISGDLNRPGAFEVNFTSTTLGDLIQMAGGVRGKSLQAIAPSGPSAGFLPAKIKLGKPLKDWLTDDAIKGLEGRSKYAGPWARDWRAKRGDATEIDVTELLLDKQVFMALRLDLGAGIVVYDETADLLEQARSCLDFFKAESCGKCVPCRLGTQQLVELARPERLTSLATASADVRETAQLLSEVMKGTAICSLGHSAANPLVTLLTRFAPPAPKPAAPPAPTTPPNPKPAAPEVRS